MLRFIGVFCAIVACLGAANPILAATFPTTVDQELLPPDIPFDQQTKVYIWEDANRSNASCMVGKLLKKNGEQDANKTGRLMVFSKKKSTGLARNLRYTVPEKVAFVPDETRSCEDPIPDLCDCILAFFAMAETFPVFAQSPRAPLETTPYIAQSSTPPIFSPRTSSRQSSGGNSPQGRDDGNPDPPTSEPPQDAPRDDTPGSAPDARENLNFTHPDIDVGLNDALILEFARVTTEENSRIYVYAPFDHGIPETGGLCGFDTGYWCTADLYFDFFEQIADLEFEMFFFGGQDSIIAQVFSGALLLSEMVLTKDGLVSFEGISGITRLVLLNDSPQIEGSAGAAFGNFSFNLSDIPLPLASTQLLLGLGLIFVLRKRRRTKLKGF